jgi:hypothetical protein
VEAFKSILIAVRRANRVGIISSADVSLFAIEKFAQIADKHELPSGWQGSQHGTDIDDTVSKPSHRANSFHVAFGVEARLEIKLLDQLEYCPKVQSVLKIAQST